MKSSRENLCQTKACYEASGLLMLLPRIHHPAHSHYNRFYPVLYKARHCNLYNIIHHHSKHYLLSSPQVCGHRQTIFISIITFWTQIFYLFFTILHPTFNVSQVRFSFVLVFAHRRVKVRSVKTTQQNKCLQIFSVDIYSWQIINNHYRAPAASPPCCPQPRKLNSSQTPAESGSQKASTSTALPSMWVENTENIFVII